MVGWRIGDDNIGRRALVKRCRWGGVFVGGAAMQVEGGSLIYFVSI